MLQNFPVTQMPRQTLFLQDDAPAHFTHHKDVRDFLNEKFSGRQICTIGPIAWPERSPLTPWISYCVPGKSTQFKRTNPQHCDCS